MRQNRRPDATLHDQKPWWMRSVGALRGRRAGEPVMARTSGAAAEYPKLITPTLS